MRRILTVPHPDLRAVCAEVGGDPGDLAGLASEMFEAMYDAKGRGLAAPQVGVLLRMFVMDAGWKDGASDRVVMINPVMASASPERVAREEVCLSIPDRVTEVSRPAAVTVRYLDLSGTAQEVTLDGPAATIAQHERDHLDGILCTDYARGA